MTVMWGDIPCNKLVHGVKLRYLKATYKWKAPALYFGVSRFALNGGSRDVFFFFLICNMIKKRIC